MFKNDAVSTPAAFNANDAVRADTAKVILSIPKGPSTFIDSI